MPRVGAKGCVPGIRGLLRSRCGRSQCPVSGRRGAYRHSGGPSIERYTSLNAPCRGEGVRTRVVAHNTRRRRSSQCPVSGRRGAYHFSSRHNTPLYTNKSQCPVSGRRGAYPSLDRILVSPLCQPPVGRRLPEAPETWSATAGRRRGRTRRPRCKMSIYKELRRLPEGLRKSGPDDLQASHLRHGGDGSHTDGPIDERSSSDTLPRR